MVNKYAYIVDLAALTARRLCSGGEPYMAFLQTAAYNFKYSFREQLLIHAQRPGATACAEIAFWNSYGRLVKQGSKGIALLVDSDTKYKLRYVFDVADTHSPRGRSLTLWQMRAEYTAPVIADLRDSFGAAADNDLAEALRQTAVNLTQDRAAAYYADLLNVGETKIPPKEDFANLLQNSVWFMLLTRCGIAYEQYLSAADFQHITEFRQPERIAVLGEAVSQTAEEVLREIAKSVQQYEKKRIRTFAENEQRSYYDNKQSNIERSADDEQHYLPSRGELSAAEFDPAAKREIGQIWNAAADISAGTEAGDLHRPAAFRAVEQTSFGDRPASDGNGGAVDQADGRERGRDGGIERRQSTAMGGADEQSAQRRRGNHVKRVDLQLSGYDYNARSEIPYYSEYDEKNELLRICDALKNHRPEIAAFFADHSDGKERGDFLKSFFDNTFIEKILSNGQRAGYRAYDDLLHIWRGSYLKPEKEVYMRWAEVADTVYGMILLEEWLGVNERPPDGVSEQLSLFEQAGQKASPAFVLPQAAIDYVLCGGSGFSRGKLRIYEQYMAGQGKDSNIKFLRKEYGIGGHSDAIPGSGYFVAYDNHGIELYKSLSSEDDYVKVLLSWKQVEKRIGELIAADRYLTPQEKADYAAMSIDDDALAEAGFEPELKTVERLAAELPPIERHDFQITDDNLGAGTPGERFARNMAAIRLLKQLESENRHATPDEQITLSQYVGWGGLAGCFDEKSSHSAELKALLSPEEYEAARESTLTAFYTPPVVIRAMYQALANLGFKGGNILEPACGSGNFIGMRPEGLAASLIYGVELDSISGRIAGELYQNAKIAVQGFENTDFPDSFFDVAIGNIPFGAFKIQDRRYDKYNFLIHDYFLARALDKVRPGGVIAFVTSKGTMDKANANVRKYLAERAELLGAVRLPNNTFKAAAGTEVTSDIIFLQKREALSCEEPDWVHLNIAENGLKINQYFIDHPEMILGEMREVSGPYGAETACLPKAGQDLAEALSAAIQNIRGNIREYTLEENEPGEEELSIPATPEVKNFSYTLVDGKIYYRENSRMQPVNLSDNTAKRVKGLIAIRDSVRRLIDYQTEDWPDSNIQAEQQQLNRLYDDFCRKFGRINSRGNAAAFNADSAYYLLCSLEILDDNGNFLRKADMFSKRTIKQKAVITSVNTANEALAVSLSEKACVDLGYMASLMGGSDKIPQLVKDLQVVIFKDPLSGAFDWEENGTHWAQGWQTAEEYLSGNVREKLRIAQRIAEDNPRDFAENVQALELVQPVDLSAGEIEVSLGSTWLPPQVAEQFVYELLETPRFSRDNIHVRYSPYSAEWNIEGKSVDKSNIKAISTYGTERANAYKIIEDTLNLRSVRVYDYVEDSNKRRVAVLNKKETAIAQGKQEQIKQAFKDWIWRDDQRREQLCRLYNDRFNNLRPREYDGSHLKFVGINPEITLRSHQINAIARIIYGGNTLLAHVVGAGKSATRS